MVEQGSDYLDEQPRGHGLTLACKYALDRSAETPSFVEDCESAAEMAESKCNWPEAVNLWFQIFIRSSEQANSRTRLKLALQRLEKTKRMNKGVDQQLISDLAECSNVHSKFRSLKSANTPDSLLENFIDACFFLDLSEEHFRLVYLIADHYFANSRLPEAKRCHLLALMLQPDHVPSWRRLGRIAYLEKDYQASRLIWGLVLQQFDVHYEAYLFLGRIAHLRSEKTEASLFFNSAISFDPNKIGAYQDLFLLHIRCKQHAEAKHVCDRFIRAMPDSLEAALMQVELAYEKGNVAETEEKFNLLFKTFPDIPKVWRAYTRFVADNQPMNKQIQFWEKIRDNHEDNVVPRIQILRAQLAAGEATQEILNTCENILEIDPEDREGLLRYAQNLYYGGETQKAYEYYQRGVIAHPFDSTFYSGLIEICLFTGQVDEARALAAAFESQSSSDSPEDYLSKAKLFHQAEFNDKASALLRAAIDKFPDSFDCLNLLGTIEMKSGRYSQALASLSAARAIKPENSEATKNYARAHAFLAFVGNSAGNEAHGVAQVLSKLAAHSPRAIPAARPYHIALVTSTLGSGGAERQVANSILGLRQLKTTNSNLSLFVDSVDPTNGHDFFLKDTLMMDEEITVLKSLRPHTSLRELIAKDLISRDVAILLGILEESIANDIATIFTQLTLQKVTIAHFWQDYTSIVGGFAALLAGVPLIVLSTRSARPDCRRRFRPYMRDAYKTLLEQKNVFMLNNSVFGARDYESWLGAKPGSIRVIHNGIDIQGCRRRADLLSGEQIREELGIPESARILGGVMRFSEQKRPDLWVDVAIEISTMDPSLHFLLVGDGPLRPSMQKRISATAVADRVHLPGNKNPVDPWFTVMDLMFLSSRVEGLPNVLIEAQSHGIPVASMPVGGAAETFKDGETGILIRSKTPTDIAKEILAFMDNKAAMTHARESAPRLAEEKFTIETMARNTMHFYESVVDSR